MVKYMFLLMGFLLITFLGMSAHAHVGNYVFGIIGASTSFIDKERAIGISCKVVRISWKDMFPEEGHPNQRYIKEKKNELNKLKKAGFKLIPDLGVHDVPLWVHLNYPNSYYVNQYGDAFAPEGIDQGTANLVFNPEMRKLVETYVASVFNAFGNDFYAVRLGWGHWGELGYPTATYADNKNTYWAFDSNARKSCPVPGWVPGRPSPNGEAKLFLNWYLDSLVDFQNWQITTARKHYDGLLMMLYPSWGVRPYQLQYAIWENLKGKTAPEQNGEIQRGYDFERLINAVTDSGVVVQTTWLDAPNSGDKGNNKSEWSPVRFLSYLADKHPLKLAKFGENAGQGDAVKMGLCLEQIQMNKLLGMVWYREEEMFSGEYATVIDYAKIINSAGVSK